MVEGCFSSCENSSGNGVTSCGTEKYCCYGLEGCDCSNLTEVFTTNAGTVLGTITAATSTTSTTSSLSSVSTTTSTKSTTTISQTLASNPSRSTSLSSATPTPTLDSTLKSVNRVAISVGVGVSVFTVSALGAGAFWFWRKRKARKSAVPNQEVEDSLIHGFYSKQELDGKSITMLVELDAKDRERVAAELDDN